MRYPKPFEPRWIGRLVLTLLFAAASTRAETAAPTAAQALFEEGRRLMQDGRYEQACAKLEESLRLDSAEGTLLNLALCHEQVGKTATAYVEYQDALALAIKARNTARVSLARRRIAELDRRLSRLVVLVPDPLREAIWVTLDGTRLGPNALGSPIPVDRGSHVLEAGAPGKEAWTTSVSVDQEGVTTEMRVPELTDTPRPVADSSPPGEEERSRRSSTSPLTRARDAAGPPSSTSTPASTRSDASGRTTWIAAGATLALGLAASVSAAYFGLDALSAWRERNRHCPGGACDARAVEASDWATRSARLADICLAVGALSGGAGAYLLLYAGNSAPPQEAPTQQPPGSAVMLVSRGVF